MKFSARYALCWSIASLLAILLSTDPLAQGYSGDTTLNRKHRDFAGKPCLDITSSAQPLASNPRIFNHIVSLDNRCFDRIRAQVCYYKSDICTDVEVPGRSRKDQVIGVLPASQQFRYDVKERF